MNPYPFIKARPPCQFGPGRLGPVAILAGISLCLANPRGAAPPCRKRLLVHQGAEGMGHYYPVMGQFFRWPAKGNHPDSPKLL